mmetsp:Transcript_892/g.3252  ORF Transcript_892/g.3252 Transcript_892/m.3252 type:complete len:106 (-) Transcript_892:7-324(-)
MPSTVTSNDGLPGSVPGKAAEATTAVRGALMTGEGPLKLGMRRPQPPADEACRLVFRDAIAETIALATLLCAFWCYADQSLPAWRDAGPQAASRASPKRTKAHGS